VWSFVLYIYLRKKKRNKKKRRKKKKKKAYSPQNSLTAVFKIHVMYIDFFQGWK
jgi:hypothetical protein